MRLRKQELYALDLEDLANMSEPEFSKNVEQRNLANYSSWLLPQLVSVFGQWKLDRCGKTTVLANCKNDFQKACWRLTRVRRSLLIKNQTQQPEYGQFTPLVLLGFKRMQGLSYEQFRPLANLEFLVEPDLLEAITQTPPQLEKNRLLEIRQQGLVFKSGAYQGKQRQAESTWQLYGIQDTELASYPKLTQTMLTQCWLAHPKHRKQTMILDLVNWDNMPPPIIEEPLAVTTPVVKTSGIPWLD